MKDVDREFGERGVDMGIEVTVVLYVVLGIGVATAMLLRDDASTGAAWFRGLSACLFWPLYVPLLLSHPVSDDMCEGDSAEESASFDSLDEMAIAINCVETELHEALDSLDGWAELTLAGELFRVDELQLAWRSQADRIRELERLLSSSATDEMTGVESDRIRHSEDARLSNLQRLREIHQRLRDDLMGTLTQVRELVTMIHLAKYTGAPASRAEDLVTQIATAIEGLTEVSELREPESLLTV